MTSEQDPGPSRLDRELEELLQELRVLLTGIAVVFAFLMGVPFTNRFATVGDTQQAIYFAAFFAAAISVVLLVVPGVWHRIRWRDHDKELLLRHANRFAILGTLSAGIAIDLVVLMISRFLYDWAFAITAAAVIGVLIAALWYVWPLGRAARSA